MKHHIRSARRFVAPLAIAALLASPHTSPAQGPTRAAMTVAAAPLRRAASPKLDAIVHPNPKQSVGLMVGGGAAVLAGAAIKGTAGGALAIVGSVAVFHGLYHYLTRSDTVVTPGPRR
jgi:hypothetical protein